LYKWINFGTPSGEYISDIDNYNSVNYYSPETTFSHQGKTYKYGKTKTINNLTFDDYINNMTIEPGIIVLDYIAEI